MLSSPSPLLNNSHSEISSLFCCAYIPYECYKTIIFSGSNMKVAQNQLDFAYVLYHFKQLCSLPCRYIETGVHKGYNENFH